MSTIWGDTDVAKTACHANKKRHHIFFNQPKVPLSTFFSTTTINIFLPTHSINFIYYYDYYYSCIDAIINFLSKEQKAEQFLR